MAASDQITFSIGESAAKLQLSFYYKCAIPSFLVILRMDGVAQGVGNEESGDSAKS